MKSIVVKILSEESDPSIRFEVLEKFYNLVDSEEDVYTIISVLNRDEDPCVRHEAAAQLFRIEEKKRHFFSDKSRNLAIKSLFARAKFDDSLVVRHESIEALGYLVDKSRLHQLEKFLESDETDIKSTAFIAVKVASNRINNNIPASQISDHILATWRSNIKN